jgi:cytochrome c peroxidase
MGRAPYFLIIILFVSCVKQETSGSRSIPRLAEIPLGFPAIDYPEDNTFSQARWELGKRLFHDPILSSDESISCASCHHADLSFTDGMVSSLGVENRPGTRNSPTLANIAYHPYFTREGGVPTLEMQILVPIQEHNEFDFNILLIADRMLEDESYISMSQDAYDREPDAFVITRAIACFERTLLSGYSPFDRFVYHEESSALNFSEVRGMQLFYSDKTNCSSCHGGFDFTNYAFENNGLYLHYEDSGRYRLTGEEIDIARFKVPSLRNIGLTAPYMHDGSMASLEEVVEHYNTGGQDHVNKNEILQPLDLTDCEKTDLVNFLLALTDTEFVNNSNFKQ